MAKIFVSFNIVSTSDFLLVARESDDPLAEVYRSDVLTPPHTVRNLTITDLNPVMHRVELWTTTDGTTLEELRGVCDIDASIINEATFGYIQFVVDRGNGAPEYDPASSQSQYVNTDLDGLTYLVYKEGFGVLKWGIDIQTISGGGFELLNGAIFSPGEGYTVQYSNVSTGASTSSGKSFPEDIIEITGDITFDSSHYNKLIEVNSNATIVTITISSLDAIPNGTQFEINTHNGTQRYVALQLNTGRYCLINGVQRNAVYLGRAEGMTFFKKGSYLRIVGPPPESFGQLGRRIFADGLQPVNTLPETGGWYLKTDYPRLFNWYIDELPALELGSGTDDVTPSADNITKWIKGATKFWVPNTKGRFFRATSTDNTIDLEGPRLSGDPQDDQVGPHDHSLIVPATATSTTASGQGRFVGGSDGNEPSAMTAVLTEDNSGDETRPRNVATNVYRII
jgi:hypothetical protein